MQFGVSSFTFGWAANNTDPAISPPFSFDSVLAFAVEQGASVMQFGENMPLHALDAAALDAFARRARAQGVVIETCGRGLTAEHLDRYIAISRQVDARFLRFVIDNPGYEPDLPRVAAIIREALPALRAADLVLGIENHDRFSCATLRRLVDELDDEHVGICLDTANSLGAGEGINEVLSCLAPVCVNLHLKDYAIERVPWLMGFTINGRPLGQGQLPFERVLETVADQGRSRTAVVELWSPPESDPKATIAKEAAWARSSTQALKAALARLHARPSPVAVR